MHLKLDSQLSEGLCVHLLDLDSDQIADSVLEADSEPCDRAQARRLRLDVDRRRFLLRRMHRRRLLGEHLGCDPGALRLEADAGGKPYLENCNLNVSTSHSQGVALIVIGGASAIGCDIQHLDEQFDWRVAAEGDVLNPDEIGHLATLAPAEARTAFFDMFCLKEAALKCVGTGFSQPGSTIDTWGSREPLHPGLKATLLRLHHGCAAAVAWSDDSPARAVSPRTAQAVA